MKWDYWFKFRKHVLVCCEIYKNGRLKFLEHGIVKEFRVVPSGQTEYLVEFNDYKMWFKENELKECSE